MEFESPDVEKEFPGLYASESGKRSNESDFSDDSHDKPSKKDLLIGKRKDKKDKKDRGYAALEGESSPDEMDGDLKSPSKSKKSKPFKFSSKKEKKEKSKDKEGRDSEKEEKKKDKKEKEGKTKLKLKERKKSKHGDDIVNLEEQPVFGVLLHLAVERNRCHDGIKLPVVVRECIDYIEEHGLNHEGIYRASGVKSKVQVLRRAYNRREPVNLHEYEAPVVSSCLKHFLRELPEPVLTTELVNRFEDAATLKDPQSQREQLASLLADLPEVNRLLLGWVLVHMDHVTEWEKCNKMNLQNVALVLCPTLQISQRLLTAFFTHQKFLFKDVTLKKYVPPISAAAASGPAALPESPTAMEEELRKQESLLNQIHEEMNAGLRSKLREEQLWEVQRIITQLKRKLRLSRRAKEGFRGESMEEKSKSEDRRNSTSACASGPETGPVEEVKPLEPDEEKVKGKQNRETLEDRYRTTDSSDDSQLESKKRKEKVVKTNEEETKIEVQKTKIPSEDAATQDAHIQQQQQQQKVLGDVAGGDASHLPLQAKSSIEDTNMDFRLQRAKSSTDEELDDVTVRGRKLSVGCSEVEKDNEVAKIIKDVNGTVADEKVMGESKSVISIVDKTLPPLAKDVIVDKPKSEEEELQEECVNVTIIKVVPGTNEDAKIPASSELEHTEEEVVDDDELQSLIQEELRLHLEGEELTSLQIDLQRRLQSERSEIQRLNNKIKEMQTLYGYRSFSVDSSDNSSDTNSEESDSDVDWEQKLAEAIKENEELEARKVGLCQRLQEERAVCVRLQVQIRMLQLQREIKEI